jgi:hypothetical protein
MRLMTFIKGAAIGAGAMYLFDPSQGRRRRALIRDKAAHAWNEAGDTVESKAHDLANRAQGVLHDAASCLSPNRLSRSIGLSAMPSWMPSKWSPTTRLLVTAGAGLLAFYGKRRGGVVGTALGALCVGILTNTVSKSDLRGSSMSTPSLPSDYFERDGHVSATDEAALSEHRPRAHKG